MFYHLTHLISALEPSEKNSCFRCSSDKKLLNFAPDPWGYTEKYQVWVVDTPDKLCTDRIFHASMSYAKNKKMSARESKYRRKAGMSWKE